MSRASSKQRRDARYQSAVRRQIQFNRGLAAYGRPCTPIEQFLRPGDTVDMFRDAEADHSKCDFAWKPVKCDRCGAEFVCTPSSDFYCAAEGDHCCEPCLLGGRRLVTVRLVGGVR